jgi:iron complex transport system substrate-binding protein
MMKHVVAISHECDYPESVGGLPRVTRSLIAADASSGEIDAEVRERMAQRRPLYEIDLDLLGELRPDVIVTQSQCEVCAISDADVRVAIDRCEALRGARVVSLNPTSLDAIFEDVRRVGDAVACAGAAEALIEGLRGRIERVRQRAAAAAGTGRPRVVCLEWVDPPMVAANWMPTLVEIAGGACGLSQAGQRSGYTPWESIVANDPDVIVVMPCGFDVGRAEAELATLRGFAGWEGLAAVRNRRVYAADGNAYFNRSGPRIVDSLELLAALIHPGAFGEFAQRYAQAWRLLA